MSPCALFDLFLGFWIFLTFWIDFCLRTRLLRSITSVSGSGASQTSSIRSYSEREAKKAAAEVVAAEVFAHPRPWCFQRGAVSSLSMERSLASASYGLGSDI